MKYVYIMQVWSVNFWYTDSTNYFSSMKALNSVLRKRSCGVITWYFTCDFKAIKELKVGDYHNFDNVQSDGAVFQYRVLKVKLN